MSAIRGVSLPPLYNLPEIRLTMYDATEIAHQLINSINHTIDKLIDLDAGASDYLRVSNDYVGSHPHLAKGKSNNYVDNNQRLLAFIRTSEQ